MNPATKESWKRLPLPSEREPLQFTDFYAHARARRIREGFVPQSMDDKWFIFAEGVWVFFIRSWTGACIFALKLYDSHQGVRVIDSWVSRNEKEYASIGVEQEKKLIADIIESYFPEEK